VSTWSTVVSLQRVQGLTTCIGWVPIRTRPQVSSTKGTSSSGRPLAAATTMLGRNRFIGTGSGSSRFSPASDPSDVSRNGKPAAPPARHHRHNRRVSRSIGVGWVYVAVAAAAAAVGTIAKGHRVGLPLHPVVLCVAS
jgi:hypothetical protein